MNKFNRKGHFGRRDSSGSGGRPDGRRSERHFGGREGGRDGGREFGRKPLEMHEVICDKCGQKCEVPFKPTFGKPVYCSDCFRKGENSESRRPNQSYHRSSGKFESDRPDKYTAEFEQINEKLDKILKALEFE